MQSVTIRLEEDTIEEIEAEVDGGGYRSRSDYLREVIQRRNEIEELEQENERLRRRVEALIEDREQRQELVEFAEEEKELAEQEREYRSRPIWERVILWFFGR